MKDRKKLLEDHKKLVEFEAAKYAGYVPLAIVTAEAYKLANKAIDDFNENSGIKFSTFLVNSLKKLSRLSTQYGGIVRIPENKQFKIQKMNVAEEELRGELGREPSLAEIANKTRTSLKEVTNLYSTRKKEVTFANVVQTPTFVTDQNDDWIHYVYHDLSDVDKIIMERKTGFGGKKILSTEELAKQLKLAASTIINRLNMITSKLAEGWKGGQL
jgi:DNA-directed RNA polymerase specialized sigma subunit